MRPGGVLTHYRLVEVIGEGGMGVVWKAEDTVLGRPVAIKLLPAEAVPDEAHRLRFLQEAKAAASIGDAHIVGIHEFARDAGVDFIVMEFVEGRPLNKLIHGRPLPADKVAEIGQQVARAVSKAHRKGLLHRDIKPSNIIVTPEGEAKVVDFGLATLFAPHDYPTTTDQSAIAEASTLTDVAQPARQPIAGTLPYMSPEQVQGEKLDARSDIFSLGAVLYEMTTGQRPFDAPGRAELASQIVKSRPVPPHEIVPKVPLDLDRMILKTMAAKPAERYQTMEDLAVDLKRLGKELESGSSPSYEELRPAAPRRSRTTLRQTAIGAGVVLALLAGAAVAVRIVGRGQPASATPTTSSPKLVAVLPFENAGGDPNMEYLSDGITESLISSLSRLDGLHVIARYTAFQYKGKRPDPRQLREELAVAAVLTGRVGRRGADLVVSAELLDTASGVRLWGEEYDRDAAAIPEVEEDVARQVAGHLQVTLTPLEAGRLSSSRSTNPKAHDLYLRGRFYLNKWGKDEFRAALDLFNQALEADPTYAVAWVGVAESYYWLSSLFMPAHEAMPKARAAVRRALEIQESLPEAHSLLAIITDRYDWEHEAADRAYRKAIALRPGDALTRNLYGQYLAIHDRPREALAEMKLAAELDPLSPYFALGHPFALLLARPAERDPSRAIQQLEKVVEAFPPFPNEHADLGLAYLRAEDLPKAIAALETGVELAADDPSALSYMAYGYAMAGRHSRAREILEKVLELKENGTYVQEYFLATAYVALGETDRAFEWLEEAYKNREESLLLAGVDPLCDPLRDDPRFIDLLRRIGLTP